MQENSQLSVRELPVNMAGPKKNWGICCHQDHSKSNPYEPHNKSLAQLKAGMIRSANNQATNHEKVDHMTFGVVNTSNFSPAVIPNLSEGIC